MATYLARSADRWPGQLGTHNPAPDVHFNEIPRGGHVAALEQPELFTAELRDSFRTLR